MPILTRAARPIISITRPLAFSVRTMATATQKLEWLVIIPDKADALPKRLEVRPKHLADIMPKHLKGDVVVGGSFMSDVPKEGETPPMIGSALVVVASSKEDVMDLLKNDVYTKGGVWDLDKVQIWPFKSAVRSGL